MPRRSDDRGGAVGMPGFLLAERMPDFLLREEQGGLALAGLGRVRAVHHVLADLDREVAADRPGSGFERVRGADHLAGGADGVLALEDERDDRAGGDELDELAEERLALVLGVVLLGELL